jgi:hypothetical protein
VTRKGRGLRVLALPEASYDEEAGMTEGVRTRNEFARALRDAVAKIVRKVGNRVAGERVERQGYRLIG